MGDRLGILSAVGFPLLYLFPIETSHTRLFECENFPYSICLRPYHVENTSSRPITEVKQHWAELVLGWVTAWEYSVL